MEDLLYGLLLLDTRVISVERPIGGRQKFVKGQGIELQQVHHSNRIGFWLGQKGPQQAAGRHDMIRIGLFLEILQGIQRLRAFLDLIEDDQGLPGLDFGPCDQR